MGNSKTLILIDGHALAFRQYYALERTGMKTSDGQPTWAVYGFFKAIFDLLKNQKIKTDAIAVTFDVSHHTFRVEKYENYKSNREQMPDAMRTQMDLIYDGLKAFNIPIYTKEGYEADDVIGTISKEACELGHKVLILTGDQDAFQLIDKDGCVKVIIPSKGELKEYDWNAVYEKLGVYPNQIIDYKALRGDTSDCIPGVRGIGEKTAQTLLTEYGTLDNIISHVDEIKANAVRNKIQTGIEDAKLSYFLATIVRDLDVSFDFDKTKVELPNIAQVTAFLTSMQFYGFIKNINTILASFNPDITPVKIEDIKTASTNNTSQVQLGLFSQAVQAEINKNDAEVKHKLITDTEDFKTLCTNLNKQNLISFSIKALVKNAVENHIIGIALAYKNGIKINDHNITADENSETETFYIPLNHTNLTKQLKICIHRLFKFRGFDTFEHITAHSFYKLSCACIIFEGIKHTRICGVKCEVFHLSVEVIGLFILPFYYGCVVQRGKDYLPKAILVFRLALTIHAVERIIANALCKSTCLVVLQLRYDVIVNVVKCKLFQLVLLFCHLTSVSFLFLIGVS